MTSMSSPPPSLALGRVLALGVVAGLVSGLLGVGGGVVIVPLLVFAAGLSQHHAHATSLAAVVPIALVGGITYLVDGRADLGIAVALAAGSLFGAPIGARIMSGLDEARLKSVFGAILIVMGAWLAWP